MEISTFFAGLWHYFVLFGMFGGPVIVLGLIAGIVIGWMCGAVLNGVFWGGGIGFVLGCIVFALILNGIRNMGM